MVIIVIIVLRDGESCLSFAVTKVAGTLAENSKNLHHKKSDDTRTPQPQEQQQQQRETTRNNTKQQYTVIATGMTVASG